MTRQILTAFLAIKSAFTSFFWWFLGRIPVILLTSAFGFAFAIIGSWFFRYATHNTLTTDRSELINTNYLTCLARQFDLSPDEKQESIAKAIVTRFDGDDGTLSEAIAERLNKTRLISAAVDCRRIKTVKQNPGVAERDATERFAQAILEQDGAEFIVYGTRGKAAAPRRTVSIASYVQSNAAEPAQERRQKPSARPNVFHDISADTLGEIVAAQTLSLWTGVWNKSKSTTVKPQQVKAAVLEAEKILKFTVALNDANTRANLLNTLATALTVIVQQEGKDDSGYLSRAETYLRSTMSLYEGELSARNIAVAKHNLGRVLMIRGLLERKHLNQRLLAAMEFVQDAKQSLLKDKWWDEYGDTSHTLGTMNRQLAEISTGEEKQKLLQSALKAYRDALAGRPRSRAQFWAQTHAAIANVQNDLLLTVPQDEIETQYRTALHEYELALEHFSPGDAFSEWASLTNNMAALRIRYATRLSAENVTFIEPRRQALMDAIEDFSMVERLTEGRLEHLATYLTAYRTQATVLVELAKLSKGSEREGFLKQALDRLRTSISLLQAGTLEHAHAQASFAEASLSYALEFLKGRDRREALEQAKKACEVAIPIYEQVSRLENAANTKALLIKVLSELAKNSRG